MSEPVSGTAYRFTDSQKKFILDTSQRLRLSTGVRVEVAFGVVNGFSAYEVILHNHGPVRKSSIALVQSLQVDSGGIEFAVRGFDGKKVGSQDSYPAFQEAVVFADVFVRSVIEKLGASPQEASPPSNQTLNEVLSASEVRLVYAFSEALGRIAEVPCSTEMKVFAPGAVTIGFFLVLKEAPILIGSMVISLAESGGIVASVRDLKNSPVINESFFPSIAEAMIAARPYFASIAQTMKKFKGRKTLLGRLRGAIGF
jgi:hypothetical protein